MYVVVNASIKDVFDKAFKPAALAALNDGVRDAVDANKSFTTKKADKLALVLTAVASVAADDQKAPRQLKATVSVDGLLTGATGQAFKATGNGTMDGLNAKKLEHDVKDLVDSVVGDVMAKKVLPQMLKLHA